MFWLKQEGLAKQRRRPGQESKQISTCTTPDPEVKKSQENITNKIAKRSALFQQVITGLQGTGNAA